MLVQYLLNGIMIGLIFGMPVGAVGAMSMQRTMRHGPLAGFLSGLASSCADVLYACVGAFGLTMISDILLDYQRPISWIGALFLILIAMQMMRNKEQRNLIKESEHKEFFSMFLSSFMVAITNPAAILSFLFAFSIFEINGSLNLFDGLQLVFGVFIGTLCWWGLLVVLVNYMKEKLHILWFHRLNIAFGVILIGFSFLVILKTL